MNVWNRKRILQAYKRNLIELADWTASRFKKLNCIRKWRENTNTKMKEAELIVLVRDFRSRKVKQLFIKELKKNMLTRRYVVLTREIYLKKTFLDKWRLMATRKERERDQEECIQGNIYHGKKCCKTILKKWVQQYGKIKEKRTREAIAVNVSRSTLRRRVFRVWKEQLREFKFQKRQMLIAERHSKKRTCLKFMGLWDQSIQNKQEYLQKMKRAHLYRVFKLKQGVINRFRQVLFQKVEEYYFMESAVVHYNRFLAINVLKGLKENVLGKQMKREEESKTINTIRKRYLFRWLKV